MARHHVETQPLVGRDLSPLLTGTVGDDAVDAPVYFMTEDQVTMGLRQKNLFTGEQFEAVGEPGKVESVITRLPTGGAGAAELWKCNHYYDRLDGTSEVESQWEVHNLTADPEERTNLAASNEAAPVLAQLRTELERTRERVRRTPQHVNA